MLIVVEGGIGTLERVSAAFKHKTPIVIVEVSFSLKNYRIKYEDYEILYREVVAVQIF